MKLILLIIVITTVLCLIGEVIEIFSNKKLEKEYQEERNFTLLKTYKEGDKFNCEVEFKGNKKDD